jgi:hypothetical protein
MHRGMDQSSVFTNKLKGLMNGLEAEYTKTNQNLPSSLILNHELFPLLSINITTPLLYLHTSPLSIFQAPTVTTKNQNTTNQRTIPQLQHHHYALHLSSLQTKLHVPNNVLLCRMSLLARPSTKRWPARGRLGYE